MSKIICHEHCPRDGRGGPGLGLVIAIVVLAAVGAAARVAAPAIESAVRTAIEVLKIAAIAAASLCGMAGAGWIAHTRLRRCSEQTRARQAISQACPYRAQRASDALNGAASGDRAA
jgi:hypothetical protein